MTPQRPYAYGDVRRQKAEFDAQNPGLEMSLPEFAQLLDEEGGEQLRSAAYNDNILKQIDYGIESAVEKTGLPTAGAWVGRGMADLLNLNPENAQIVEDVGRYVPRMVGEGALTLVTPGGLIGRGGMLAARGLGYGSAALRGYTETDSGLGALVAPVQLAAGNYLGAAIHKGVTPAIANWLNRKVPMPNLPAATTAGVTTEELLRGVPQIPAALNQTARVLPVAGAQAAEIAAGLPINETARQFMLSAQGVPWSDWEARDPFTEENFVANAAGTAAFAPFYARNLYKAPRVNLKASEALSSWLNERDKFLETQTWEQTPGGKKTVPDPSLEGAPTMRTAMMDTVASALAEAQRTGDVEGVELNQRALSRLLFQYDKDLDANVKAAESLKEIAAEAAPRNPEEWKRFMDEYNLVVDAFHKNWLDEKFVGSPESKGKTWHPATRDPAVIKQLQDEGYLPRLTPELLEKEFGFFLDRSLGDSAFASRAVAEKAANFLYDRIDQALLARGQQRKVDHVPDLKQKRAIEKELAAEETYQNSLNKLYTDALIKLPPEVRQELFNRHVQIQEQLDVAGGDVQKGTSMLSFFPGWRDMVVQAAQTYDPVSNTWRYKKVVREENPDKPGSFRVKRDAQGQPVFVEQIYRLEDLWRKDPKDRRKYFLYPDKSKSVRVSELGQSLDAPLDPDGKRTGMDIVPDDEQQFYTDLAEGVYGTQGIPTTEGVVGRDPAEGLVEFNIAGPSASAADSDLWANRARILRETMEKGAENEGLWNKVRDLYVQRTPLGFEKASPQNGFRQRHFKLALQALIEEGFLFGKGEAQRREVGEAGKAFMELARARNMFIERGVAGTERRQLGVALRNFFRRGAEPLDVMLRQVIERLTAADPSEVQRLSEDTPQTSAIRYSNGITDVYTESRNPGTFSQEFYRTIDNELGKLGYTGSSRQFLREIVAAVALKGDERNVQFYTIEKGTADQGILGSAAVSPGGLIGRLGLRVDRKPTSTLTREQVVQQMIHTTLHELSHVDDYVISGRIADTDAYSQQQKQVLQKFQQVTDSMTDEERAVVLRTVRDAMMPKEFVPASLEDGEYPTIPGSKGSPAIYGQQSGSEFRAQIRGIVERSMLLGESTGVKGLKEVMKFLPEEVERYMAYKYRTIGDVLDSARKVITYPEYAKQFNQDRAASAKLGALLETTVLAARALSDISKSTEARAKMQKLITTMEPGGLFPLVEAGVMRTFATPDEAAAFIQDAALEVGGPIRNAEAAVKEAQKFMFRDKTEKGAKPSLLHRFAPFYNFLHRMERNGVPLAGDIWNLAAGITPGIHRFESNMLKPFLRKNAQGRYEFDTDNKLLKMITSDPKGRWRSVFNGMRRYQNEHDYKPLFVQEQNGLVTMTEEGRKATESSREWAALTAEQKEAVMVGMVAMDQVYQEAAGMLLSGVMKRIQYRVTTTLMARNKGMTYNEATGLSAAVVDAYVRGDTTALAGKILPDQIEAFTRLLAGTGPGDEGLLGQYTKIQKQLTSRPGFSSEQLPHDWILQYKDAEGKTRFLSAETERGAEKLMRQLIEKEGVQQTSEIYNRREVGRYNDFDDPSEVLSKFVEVEQGVWDKFVAGLAEKDPVLAETLKTQYQPGETTTKELHRQGLSKFLQKNEGKVDTTKLDYLESMGTYVGRLSASLVFREVRENLNLIMNDPRGKPYKTFKEQVAEHFDFLFSPTPKEMSEWKSMLAAYYMGLNLSSTIVESTQSAVTLVPTLLNLGKGSLVGAYKTLWSSITDMVDFRKDDWQVRARRARAKETPTAEDERLLMYERAVADGLIDHGVIQDMDFGRDQRLLMTARFGRGEFSEVSPFQMAKDKMYVGSQHMMRLYSWMAIGNSKLAFLAGVRQGQELGLKGDALYAHARKVKDLATFGGGKVNIPTYVSQWSSPRTRNAFILMHTLQQYGMGMLSTYAGLMKDSYGKNLPPLQRRQAQKALGTMMMTQVALAGALGLPFAAAALTVLEKTFGIEANRAVREGLASMAGEDEDGNISEAGVIMADTILNGAGNQLFGIDISSRLGVSNLFGTSAYRGFNVVDMFGPLPGVLENAYASLQYFGQGEPVKAVKSLVPQAFKNTMEMAESASKYGDVAFRDKTGDMVYDPSTAQKFAYSIGFRPRELSAKRQAQAMIGLADQNAILARQRVVASGARSILNGDTLGASRAVQQLLEADPGADVNDLWRAVINQSVEMTTPKDVTRTGPSAAADDRLSIARLMGQEVVPQASETERTMRAMMTSMQMGRPDLYGFDQVGRSVMLDRLMQNRRMSRTEALRYLARMGM